MMDELIADLRRQTNAAFVECLIAQQRRDPELKRMLAQMVRESRRAYEQLQRDQFHQVP
jgi:hypothetical protein